MPSDEILLHAHNVISSSTDLAKTKQIIQNYPQVLSFHVLDWGGSILLHTVCSRQPLNIELILLVITEGLKYNVGGSGGSGSGRGGLVIKDNFGRTPLNILVGNNAISTLRYLLHYHDHHDHDHDQTQNQTQQHQQNHNTENCKLINNGSINSTPPLLYPQDVIQYQLFKSVHSTYHTDMVQFLIHLNPQSVKKVMKQKRNFYSSTPDNDENSNEKDDGLLIHQMCIETTDTRFLLRIIPILIQEGIRQHVGEDETSSENENDSENNTIHYGYGIGGLFVPHPQLGVTAADLLIDRRQLSWSTLGPILRGLVMVENPPSTLSTSIIPSSPTSSLPPILHGAIMTKTITITNSSSPISSPSYSKHLHGICKNIPQSTLVRDRRGRLAIHLAAQMGLDWKRDCMEDIVMGNIGGVKENDPVTGLPVYALAAAAGTMYDSGSGEKMEYFDYSLCTIYELLSFCIDDFS